MDDQDLILPFVFIYSSHKPMTDTDLLSRFEYFGKKALEYRNKVIGLLPEVSRRKLYEKRGCFSVYEYAKKVAGLSEEQVSRALNVFKNFIDKPALKKLLEEGTVSVNKLSRVASIATVENQEMLAEKIQIMSQSAIETFVRDIRQGASEAEIVRTHKPESNLLFAQEPRLEADVRERLLELERKGIDINQLLRETLDRREKEITQAKERVAESLPERSSRYIPVRVRNIIKKEYGQKCAKNGCQKPSQNIHHMRRWALDASHDPNFLAPLCREHHQIAHAIDVKFHEMRRR